jgi:hypothetical protein
VTAPTCLINPSVVPSKINESSLEGVNLRVAEVRRGLQRLPF